MTRGIKPENQALQDRIAAVLADEWPEMLTSAQIAERVGGVRTIWEVCAQHNPALAKLRAERPGVDWCRADRESMQQPRHDGHEWNPKHHPGPVPQDSWEVPWNAMDMNAPLNRLARDGAVEKIKVQALRAVLWRWAGDRDDATLTELESLWSQS